MATFFHQIHARCGEFKISPHMSRGKTWIFSSCGEFFTFFLMFFIAFNVHQARCVWGYIGYNIQNAASHFKILVLARILWREYFYLGNIIGGGWVPMGTTLLCWRTTNPTNLTNTAQHAQQTPEQSHNLFWNWSSFGLPCPSLLHCYCWDLRSKTPSQLWCWQLQKSTQ